MVAVPPVPVIEYVYMTNTIIGGAQGEVTAKIRTDEFSPYRIIGFSFTYESLVADTLSNVFNDWFQMAPILRVNGFPVLNSRMKVSPDTGAISRPLLTHFTTVRNYAYEGTSVNCHLTAEGGGDLDYVWKGGELVFGFSKETGMIGPGASGSFTVILEKILRK